MDWIEGASSRKDRGVLLLAKRLHGYPYGTAQRHRMFWRSVERSWFAYRNLEAAAAGWALRGIPPSSFPLEYR